MSDLAEDNDYVNMEGNHYSKIGEDAPPPPTAAAAATVDDGPEVILLCTAIIRLHIERDQLRKDLKQLQQQSALEKEAKEARFMVWLTGGMEETERHQFVAHRDRRLQEHNAAFDELAVIAEWIQSAEDLGASATS